MPTHYDDGEYKGSEHATDVFKAPPKKETEGTPGLPPGVTMG